MTVILKLMASGIFPRFGLFFSKSKSTVQREEYVASHCSSQSEHPKAKANEITNKSKTVRSTREMQRVLMDGGREITPGGGEREGSPQIKLYLDSS